MFQIELPDTPAACVLQQYVYAQIMYHRTHDCTYADRRYDCIYYSAYLSV